MSNFLIVRNLYLALILFLGIADYFFFNLHFVWYLTPSLIFLSLIFVGSANIRSNFFLKTISSLPTEEKAIAITFDDGPSPAYTPIILNLLKQFNAKATFFCVGKNIESNVALTKEISLAGHAIGNHSYGHSNFFSFYGKRKVLKELKKTNQIILEATGEACDIFRPPYGVTNPPIANALKECPMTTIGWSIRSMDTTTKDYNKVIKKVLKKIKPGAVILLHDDRPNTGKILEAILLYTRENNYKCVSIQNTLNKKYAFQK